MTGIPSEHAHDVREALRIVVSDPGHGPATLSNPQVMSNLLKDLLPDAPREKNLLVAAADANLAGMMLDRVAQGIDARSAIRLAAASFGATTHFSDAACTWVSTELAVALDLGADLATERTELPAGEITAAGPRPAPLPTEPHQAGRPGSAESRAAQAAESRAAQAAAADANWRDAAAPRAPVPDGAIPRAPAPDARGRYGIRSVLGAVLVLAGVLALTLACAEPVYNGSPPGRIWGGGSSGSLFIASAPTAALVVALLAGVLLLLAGGRPTRLVAAGAALACGAEVTVIFFAIFWQAIRDYGNSADIGLALGLVSGVLLIAGGALGLRHGPGTEPAGG